MNSPYQRRLSVEELENRLCLATQVELVYNLNQENVWHKVNELTTVGEQIYFVGKTVGSNQLELWTIQENSNSTSRIAVLGDDDNQPRGLTPIDGILYFNGYSSTTGRELWRTDGTTQGTYIVSDLTVGPNNSEIKGLVRFNGAIYFSGNGELYRYNLATKTATKVIDLVSGSSDQVDRLTVSGGHLYFTGVTSPGNSTLYRSDGNAAGTVSTGVTGTSIDNLFDLNGDLSFSRNDNQLWRVDHPGVTPTMFLNLGADSIQGLKEFTNFNGKLAYATYYGIGITDGTTIGSTSLDVVGAAELTTFDNKLYFQAGDIFFDGIELWTSDGTQAGTLMVKDINPAFNEGYGYGSYPSDFQIVRGRLYFSSSLGIWESDGTTSGTQSVEAHPGPDIASTVSGALFYTRRSSQANQMQMLKLIPGLESRLIQRTGPGNGDANPTKPVLLRNAIYFGGSDGKTGNELYRIGSSGVPQLVADLIPGSIGSNVADLTVANGRLYFTASTLTQGRGLWTSDGTQQGTQFLSSVTLDGREPNNGMIPFGNRVMFKGYSAATGYELWSTDGTAAGTLLVKDIFPGSAYDPYSNSFIINSSHPNQFNSFGNLLYFVASGNSNNREIWRSDGTTQGTYMILDLYPGSDPYYPYANYSSSPVGLQVHAGSMYFSF